ncbi:B12-binding domain-containing radical SAM protein [Fundidesulfovibrio agrisoli]|uniref:B12-binding domain-containing radical SAM protein n=1 Tax=Fundidesulfovibrio agrisoli TaxID=2922717 RepID=UPI001FABDC0D|nr:radical SAM protein [Fundidesulfovibrio agrisoli]
MATVLFLQRDGYESFGPMYLSAALARRGHRAEVLVEVEEGRGFMAAVAAAKPDIVAFSLMSGLQDWAARTARAVKRLMNVPVIAGGPHCTFFPEFIEEEGIDAVCRGEAEDALPDFADALAAGGDGSDVPGFWVKTARGVAKNEIYPLRPDLDSLPRPDRTLYARRYPQLARSSGAQILVARGCPYSCSFCYNRVLRGLYKGKGSYIRRHGHRRVLDEIRDIAASRSAPLRYVTFVDDLFVQDSEWLEGFLELYRAEVGLPFMCGVRANLMDEALTKLLARSGCRMVSFGVESGDAAMRNETLNKKISEEQIVRTAAMLHAHGIRFSTFNMFNLPGETLEKAVATLRLNQRIRAGNHPWSGLLQPYRGTDVYDIALRMGLIPQGETGANLFTSATLRQPDTDALERFNAYFYWMVRYPWLERPLMALVKHPVPVLGPVLAKVSSLAVSLHRYACLFAPFEGWMGALGTAVRDGLRRIRSYL